MQGSSRKWRESCEIGHMLNSSIIYKARVAKEIICFTVSSDMPQIGHPVWPFHTITPKTRPEILSGNRLYQLISEIFLLKFLQLITQDNFINSCCPGSFNSYMNKTMYNLYIHKWTIQCSTYNFPRIGAVKALQQCHYCTLSTSRCTNQCDSLSRFHFKIQPSQYWNSRPVGIPEVNIMKSHPSKDFLKIILSIKNKFLQSKSWLTGSKFHKIVVAKQFTKKIYIHTHTHTYIYMYISIKYYVFLMFCWPCAPV